MESKQTFSFQKLLNQNALIIIAGLGCSFIATWLTTKVMDKASVGIYQIMINSLETIALISTAGFQLLATKEIPKMIQSKTKIDRFLKQGLRMLFFSLTLFLPLFYAFMYGKEADSNYNIALMITIIGIPAFALLKFYSSILQSNKRFWLAHLPERLLRPLLVIGVCLVLFNSNTGNALFALLISIVILVFVFGLYFYVKVGSIKKSLINPSVKNNYYKASILLVPFFLFSNLIMRIDGYMLWYFEPAETFAVYAQCMKIASICTVGLILFEYIFTPFISENTSTEEKNNISKMMVSKLRIVVLITVAFFAFIAFFGETILGWFGKFEDAYTVGYTSLIILSIAHIIGLGFGPVSNILIVRNESKRALGAVVFAFIINIILNAFLIPLYGMHGAAYATAVSLILYKIFAYWMVRKHCGYQCAIFDRA